MHLAGINVENTPITDIEVYTIQPKGVLTAPTICYRNIDDTFSVASLQTSTRTGSRGNAAMAHDMKAILRQGKRDKPVKTPYRSIQPRDDDDLGVQGCA